MSHFQFWLKVHELRACKSRVKHELSDWVNPHMCHHKEPNEYLHSMCCHVFHSTSNALSPPPTNACPLPLHPRSIFQKNNVVPNFLSNNFQKNDVDCLRTNPLEITCFRMNTELWTTYELSH